MEPFIIVFSSAGELSDKDIVKECQQEGWTPISVIREADRTVVPFFESKKVAAQFCTRNFGREICGIVELTPEDVSRIQQRWVHEKGFVLEKFTYPNKVAKRGELDIEIHEFVEKPDVLKAKSLRIDVPTLNWGLNISLNTN